MFFHSKMLLDVHSLIFYHKWKVLYKHSLLLFIHGALQVHELHICFSAVIYQKETMTEAQQEALQPLPSHSFILLYANKTMINRFWDCDCSQRDYAWQQSSGTALTWARKNKTTHDCKFIWRNVKKCKCEELVAYRGAFIIFYFFPERYQNFLKQHFFFILSSKTDAVPLQLQPVIIKVRV